MHILGLGWNSPPVYAMFNERLEAIDAGNQ